MSLTSGGASFHRYFLFSLEPIKSNSQWTNHARVCAGVGSNLHETEHVHIRVYSRAPSGHWAVDVWPPPPPEPCPRLAQRTLTIVIFVDGAFLRGPFLSLDFQVLSFNVTNGNEMQENKEN